MTVSELRTFLIVCSVATAVLIGVVVYVTAKHHKQDRRDYS